MTFTIIWEPVALDHAARFLADDAQGLRELFQAVDALADQPRPAQTFPLGASGLHRLRVGRYRAVYEIDEVTGTIKIRHVGRRA